MKTFIDSKGVSQFYTCASDDARLLFLSKSQRRSEREYCHEAKLALAEPSFDLENHLSKMTCDANSSAYCSILNPNI